MVMTVEMIISGILLAPLVGIVINTIGLGSFRRPVSGWISTLMIAITAILSINLFFSLGDPVTWILYEWISTQLFSLNIGFHVDRLTVLMLLVVSVVSTCVHLYSIEYMENDKGFSRFFIYLNLFVFSMFILVTASSLPMLFIGWEGVGLCSYLLIGFWYERESARNAGQKAFIVNRLGDFSFLIGMFLCLEFFGTLSFVGIEGAISGASHFQLWSVGLLLFGGAVGKSAQFPLYVWLPDAMEGPTPVSSLIHAATMVTAGVYLIARLGFLYSQIPSAGHIIAAIGAFTALFAATIATVHEDLKRILAYSTISQLGYMFVGVGMGAYGAGIFHLMTHAFFKGLLFLMAGSVMHALHGELNIFRMNNLWEKLPITGVFAIIGGLGLSGFPLISGFWSKDKVLLASIGHGSLFNWIIFGVLLFAALLTSFYTFRMVFVAFFTEAREEVTYNSATVHEPGWKMTVPMAILALGTLLGYFFGGMASKLTHGHSAHGYHNLVMVSSVVVSLLGLALAWWFYLKKFVDSFSNLSILESLNSSIRNQYYVEKFYRIAILRPIHSISNFSWKVLDDLFIDGLVNLTGAMTEISGLVLRFVQTGRVRHYLIYITTGFSILFAIMVYAWV